MSAGRFQEKCVIVTGAGSGIGKASAELFAREGANLVLADLNLDAARGVAETIARAHRVRATAIRFDASNASSCQEMIDESVRICGKLDVLCNIAGIMDWDPLARFSEARWECMIAINLSSVFHASQRAMPHLVQSKGCIVNMASAAALVGIAYTTAYCAAKAGVVAITKSLAIEFAAAGVRVNAICPTGVRTPMNEHTRWPEGINMDLLTRNASKLRGGELCEASDVAAAVLFLASDDARFISGIALPVDGAQTAG